MIKYLLYILLPFSIFSANLSDILFLNIPKTSYFIRSLDSYLNEKTKAEISASLTPTISLGNNINYLGFSHDFETYNLRQTFNNTMGLSFSISPGVTQLSVNRKKENYLTISSEIIALYGDIELLISEAKDYIENLRFQKEYRKALTDYKQQLAQDEIIFDMKKSIVRKYHDIVKLQLSLYTKAGISIHYDNAEFNYNYEKIEKIIRK